MTTEEKAQALMTLINHLEKTHGHFTWQAPFPHLVVLISQVQLALRHPHNKGRAAKIARMIVDNWIQSLDAAAPGLGELLRQGDDPACDVPWKA